MTAPKKKKRKKNRKLNSSLLSLSSRKRLGLGSNPNNPKEHSSLRKLAMRTMTTPTDCWLGNPSLLQSLSRTSRRNLTRSRKLTLSMMLREAWWLSWNLQNRRKILNCSCSRRKNKKTCLSPQRSSSKSSKKKKKRRKKMRSRNLLQKSKKYKKEGLLLRSPNPCPSKKEDRSDWKSKNFLISEETTPAQSNLQRQPRTWRKNRTRFRPPPKQRGQGRSKKTPWDCPWVQDRYFWIN